LPRKIKAVANATKGRAETKDTKALTGAEDVPDVVEI
jgi:hypothetical protein